MKPKPKLRARRMWANYYPENPVRPVLHKSLQDAKHCVAPGATHEAIPIAVVPLDDVGGMMQRASCVVDNMISTATIGDIVRAVLVSSGVLPRQRKGGRQMKHLNLTPEQFCDATKACKNGREFALTQKTMADVWAHCPKAEWLLWILDVIDAPRDDKQLRLFAVWCARNTPMPDGRTTGALLTDPRGIAALEVAERYAHGTATVAELAAARAAACDAACAAAWAAACDAARDAELAASQAAARAAACAAAWAAACAAAWDAARAAARAASQAAARDAACDAARAAQADQLRKMVANPFAQGGAK